LLRTQDKIVEVQSSGWSLASSEKDTSGIAGRVGEGKSQPRPSSTGAVQNTLRRCCRHGDSVGGRDGSHYRDKGSKFGFNECSGESGKVGRERRDRNSPK